MQRDKASDHAIHNTFWNLVTCSIQYGWIGHQVTHIANKHETATI